MVRIRAERNCGLREIALFWITFTDFKIKIASCGLQIASEENFFQLRAALVVLEGISIPNFYTTNEILLRLKI